MLEISVFDHIYWAALSLSFRLISIYEHYYIAWGPQVTIIYSDSLDSKNFKNMRTTISYQYH